MEKNGNINADKPHGGAAEVREEYIMLRTAREFMRACDASGLKYKDDRELDSGKYLVVCGVNGSSGNSYDVMFLFDQDEESVGLRVYGLAKCNRDSYAKALLKVNALNDRFRWFKFVIDKDNDINMEMDAVITPRTAGDVCTELLRRCMSVAKDAYPELMRVLWG